MGAWRCALQLGPELGSLWLPGACCQTALPLSRGTPAWGTYGRERGVKVRFPWGGGEWRVMFGDPVLLAHLRVGGLGTWDRAKSATMEPRLQHLRGSLRHTLAAF